FNNGAIEGINNKIKLIKRISFGYRNLVKSRLLCKMLYNVFTISTYQN
ncbi:transposase, partial [Staphylococcus aureus]|nr:transposase [Staphylococcus aureus]